MKIFPQTLVVVLCCAIGLVACAQDWPQYLGKNRAAQASLSAPKSWPKELTPKWKVTVGAGVGTPALGGGDRGGVIAYDLKTGAEKWRWEGGGASYASPVFLTAAGTK